jgi:hypothetical protein
MIVTDGDPADAFAVEPLDPVVALLAQPLKASTAAAVTAVAVHRCLLNERLSRMYFS